MKDTKGKPPNVKFRASRSKSERDFHLLRGRRGMTAARGFAAKSTAPRGYGESGRADLFLARLLL
jgi:hypothetical protein